MALYIFSDAHLGSGTEEAEAHKIAQISHLFEMVREDGDRLVILGDLFDFWFEYKHAIPKDHFQMLLMLGQMVRSGVKVDYISGNHDFWMDDYFEKQVGVAVHRDFLDIEYDTRQLHLIHGDGLAKSDWGYRILKRILQNRLNIWLYRKLPPDWGIPLAKAVSGSSREYTSKRDLNFVAEYEAYAQQRLNDGFDIVAIGHLHIPSVKKFSGGTYINTGDFINNFTYAKMQRGEITLKTLE
jgi:UDP-2,3-diacylglucosamine hydrolase